MKIRQIVAAWMVVAAVCTVPAYAQQAVVIVRHAEKIDDSTDSKLSPAGERRAKALAGLLAEAGISAIYTTQFQRTAQTAQPLADQLKIKARVVEAKDVAALATRLRTEHGGQVVLVVGHSDTVPNIIKALGSSEYVDIPHDEFNDLFVLVPRPQTEPFLLRLRFAP